MFNLNGTAVITIATLLLVTSLICSPNYEQLKYFQHSVGHTDSTDFNFH